MYTFWDYMRNRWPRDAGLRIDHLLLNPAAAKRISSGVDREIRGLENASDHAPAWILLSDRQAVRNPQRTGSTSSPAKSKRKGARATPAPSRPLLVIDGDSFAHRSYHALPKTILGRGGKPAGAILGFANLLLRLYREEQPRTVGVAWDTLDVPTYRHVEFPAYQSGREFDDALLAQLDLIPEFVAACGFQNAKAPCFEADDFLDAALKAGRFTAYAESLRLFRSIATMSRKAPLPSLRSQKPTWDRAAGLAQEWELNQLTRRLKEYALG